ncbi:hypothetical protein B0H19DRAFT_1066801 [Mycena capillaripes]|nr:hypothetical protein B0H19DRAFT_1066801 [Mycena capillaripes]
MSPVVNAPIAAPRAHVRIGFLAERVVQRPISPTATNTISMLRITPPISPSTVATASTPKFIPSSSKQWHIPSPEHAKQHRIVLCTLMFRTAADVFDACFFRGMDAELPAQKKQRVRQLMCPPMVRQGCCLVAL